MNLLKSLNNLIIMKAPKVNRFSDRERPWGFCFFGDTMSLSKKKRFEVLKRDGFTCAYCGRTPPTVILEVDHIEPVSKGGSNDQDNLITSCFDCNRGKTNIPLNVVSESIEEKHHRIIEKEEQLLEFRKYKKRIQRRKNKDIKEITAIFEEYYPDRTFTDGFKRRSLGRFIDKLPKEEIIEAMDIAATKMEDEWYNAIKYFCGICWKRIRENEELSSDDS